MTSSEEISDRPSGSLEKIKYSVGNLWDDFGSTSSPLLGFVVNLGLAAIGLLVYWQTTGWLSYAGAVWAILHVLAIVQWVMRL